MIHPKSHFPTWLGALLILTTAAIAGGGAYLVSKAQYEATTQELEAQIQDLSERLSQTNSEKKKDDTTPDSVTFDEKNFSIVTLSGWTEDPKTRIGHDGKPSYHYKDGNGNFFEVWLDAQGSDFASDAAWRYSVNKDGVTIKIKSESEQCAEGDGFCSAGDNKLHIWMLSEKPGEIKIKDHSYHFVFGNETKETGVELDVFRNIIKSFTAK